MELKKIPRGEIDGIPTIVKFKGIMIELFKGYPAFQYFGIFESYFGKELGEEIVKILHQDGLLEIFPKKENEPTRYRLTANEINMAISMINLDYSEETSNYNKNMHRFTVWIIWLTIITAIMGVIQIAPFVLKLVQWLMSNGIRA
jgi:hypothetical protein